MNSENSKTAKELAAELNVSVNTIYRRLKAINQDGKYTIKAGGVIRITKEGADIISGQLQQPEQATGGAQASTHTPTIDAATQAIIDMQQAHIETLTRLLDNANKQLEMERQTRLLEADNERKRLGEPTQYNAEYSENITEEKTGDFHADFHAEKRTRENEKELTKSDKTRKRTIISRLQEFITRK